MIALGMPVCSASCYRLLVPHAVFLFLLVAEDIVLLWTFGFMFTPIAANVLHASVQPGVLVALRTVLGAPKAL